MSRCDEGEHPVLRKLRGRWRCAVCETPATVTFVGEHDCLSGYRHGETTPWTCPLCGEVWVVRESRWVKAEAVAPTS